jgi:release factor family 3
MSHISANQLRELLDAATRPCVSIFLPTFRAGAETQQNPIRFKNLLRQALEKLGEMGWEPRAAADLMVPAEELVGDEGFWQHQEDGLAVFVAPGFFRTFRLARSFHERAVVNDKFFLRPLFPLLSGDEHFYLLALSVNEVRLFVARQDRVHELDLGDAPRSLADALGRDLTEPVLRFNVSSPAAQARTGAPNYHGQGGGEDESKAEIQQFFQRLDSGLQALHLDRRSPLVLAGVGYLLPLYREITRWPEEVLELPVGNPEGWKPEDLCDRAWPLVEPRFTADRERAAARFAELVGTGRASAQLEEVIPAAHDGRVDVLFTAQGAHLPGIYDPGARAVRLAGNGNGEDDLLDDAAVQTFLHGGTVFAVPPEAVPAHGEPLAAVFRY